MRRDQSGQALVLCLVVGTVLLAGFGILAGFGQALGGKSRHQRGADLAAMSAAGRMRGDYPRLFEPPLLANGLPNPRHMPLPVYLARARAAAVRACGSQRDHAVAGAGDVPGWDVRAHARGGEGGRFGHGPGGGGARTDPGDRPRGGRDQPGLRRGDGDAQPWDRRRL